MTTEEQRQQNQGIGIQAQQENPEGAMRVNGMAPKQAKVTEPDDS
jgi:hypothetical protein